MADKNFVSFICTACQQEIETATSTVGQVIECPSCGAKLTVPAPDQGPTAGQLEAMKSRTIRIELPDL